MQAGHRAQHGGCPLAGGYPPQGAAHAGVVEMPTRPGEHARRGGDAAQRRGQLPRPLDEALALQQALRCLGVMKAPQVGDPVGDLRIAPQGTLGLQRRQLRGAKAQAGQARVQVHGHWQAGTGARSVARQRRQFVGASEHWRQPLRSEVLRAGTGQPVEHQDTRSTRSGIAQAVAHGQRLVQRGHPELAAAQGPQLRHHGRHAQAIGIVFHHGAHGLAHASGAHGAPVVRQRVKIQGQARSVVRGVQGCPPLAGATRRRLPGAWPGAMPCQPWASRPSWPGMSSCASSRAGAPCASAAPGTRASR